MFKLREKFNFDLNQSYIYYSICSNVLLLNKKLYLLFNFWNKRQDFFLLKKKKLNINFQSFNSLNYNIYSNYYNYDYFNKWSSSFLQFTDLIKKKRFNNRNKKKYLIEVLLNIDYTVYDNIFSNYIVNDKKNFYYFSKNNFFYRFFFKLTKKDNFKFKLYMYNYLYNNLDILNKNYNNLFFNNYWKNIEDCNNFILYIKLYINKNINKFIYLYFYLYKYKNINKYYINFINNLYGFSYKNLYFLRNYFTNKKNKFLYYFKLFFQYIFFRKKLLRKFKRFFFVKYHIYKNTDKFNKLKKKNFKLLMKQKFRSIMGYNIYKNITKNQFFSTLIKFKNKRKFLRNFYKFNSNFFYKLNLKKKLCKKKKIMNFRYLKKLKTFYYNPNLGRKTKKQVYKRFKRSVRFKMLKRKRRKKNAICGGLWFNLFVYNKRNRYKNKMELLKLKKRSTPDHYYFLRRKNNYIDKKGIIKVTYKELPFFVVKRYKLDVRNSIHFQSREDYIKEFNVLNSFQEYSSKFINNDNKLISGRKFKEKRYKFLYNKFKKLNYVLKKRSGSYLFFKDLINNYKRRKKEERVNKYMPLYNNLNSEIKKKKNFWFYQKILLYWKILLKLKNNSKFINFNYNFYSLNKIYVKFFLNSIKFIKWFSFFNLNIKKKRKKKYLFWFISNIFCLFKYIYFFFFNYIKNFNKFIKNFNIIKKKKIFKRGLEKKKKYLLLRKKYSKKKIFKNEYFFLKYIFFKKKKKKKNFFLT